MKSLTASSEQAAKTPAPNAQKLAYSVDEACAITGLSRSFLYEEIRASRLAARKAGSRTLVLRQDLEEFLAGLPAV